MNQNSTPEFDFTLAKECADAFAGSTGLGCTVSDAAGALLYESGYGCTGCRLCHTAGRKQEICVQSHIYGMTEAARFGGKYIYFCPMGLTCFVSPIIGIEDSAAKITVGPFLMVDQQDYIACDLMEIHGLQGAALNRTTQELKRIPVVSTETVNRLSTLLFMAVGFINNTAAASRMLEIQSSNAIQGQITSYIMQLKSEAPHPYPFHTERGLLTAIGQGEKAQAHSFLNELFGYISFSSGGDFLKEKSRVYELLVLISRAAIDAGADPDRTLNLTHDSLNALPRIHDTEALCHWLTRILNRFMDNVFAFTDTKHAQSIHKVTQHLRTHFSEKITLGEMAAMVYLSPAYFSRIFKCETGVTFNAYLNRMRVEKSKEMLLYKNLRLTDIALMVGFEDQSYFTKVFKRVTGVIPLKYRETHPSMKQTRR